MNALSSACVPGPGFEAAADPQEMSAFMRERLPVEIDGLRQVLLLACMDKEKIVAFLEERIRDGGDRVAIDFFDEVQATSDWLASAAGLASSVAARVLVAMHQIAGIPVEEA